MRGGTRAALELGAVVLLPTIAGLLLLGVLIERVAQAIDDAHEGFEDAVRTEMAHWLGSGS